MRMRVVILRLPLSLTIFIVVVKMSYSLSLQHHRIIIGKHRSFTFYFTVFNINPSTTILIAETIQLYVAAASARLRSNICWRLPALMME